MRKEEEERSDEAGERERGGRKQVYLVGGMMWHCYTETEWPSEGLATQALIGTISCLLTSTVAYVICIRDIWIDYVYFRRD